MPDSSSLQPIVCCMGQPVEGNPTQFMMERAFAAAGLEWRDLTLEVSPEDLQAAVAGLKAMGFRGGNFTIPHKVAVVPLLDDLSQAAELMGAVNCVVAHTAADDAGKKSTRLMGENTDGKGFVQSLRELTDPKDKKIVILGAGGAARAIAVELGLAGAAEITVVNRDQGRGSSLADLLSQRVQVPATWVAWEGDFSVPPETHVVINATSIGLGDPDARVPLLISSLESEMVVADVIFNPPETRLVREARQRGCSVLDGLGMLVNQGVIGFKLWTGVDPDPQVMREALEEYLEL